MISQNTAIVMYNIRLLSFEAQSRLKYFPKQLLLLPQSETVRRNNMQNSIPQLVPRNQPRKSFLGIFTQSLKTQVLKSFQQILLIIVVFDFHYNSLVIAK